MNDLVLYAGRYPLTLTTTQCVEVKGPPMRCGRWYPSVGNITTSYTVEEIEILLNCSKLRHSPT